MQRQTTPENFITAFGETSDTPAVYPSAALQTASYNNLNQLTNLSGQALSYDAGGNLLSDGQRTCAWNAENRLVGITYPGQPGKQTAFAYDGLGRRTSITSTPAGWRQCGRDIVSLVWDPHLSGARCQQCDDARLLRGGRIRSRLAGAILFLWTRPDRLGAPCLPAR